MLKRALSAAWMLLESRRASTAHSEEPTAKWARWHVLGVWGFHEDFHIALLGAELCWLVMVTHVFAIA